MGFIIIIASICIAEHFIKRYIVQHVKPGSKIMKDNITLHHYHNKGVALNVFQHHVKFVKILTGSLIGILLVLLGWLIGQKKGFLCKLGLSLMVGGALSNFVDRIKNGDVFDYFSVNHGKKLKTIIFNIADVAVLLGGILTAIGTIFCSKDK